ncbi:hypothetical protein DH09_08140 [Bacillaceae bacterium JMAK1]|nr:hypothetical protein DH09_08140 [Bacillaceae bacterium JMAK1]
MSNEGQGIGLPTMMKKLPDGYAQRTSDEGVEGKLDKILEKLNQSTGSNVNNEILGRDITIAPGGRTIVTQKRSSFTEKYKEFYLSARSEENHKWRVELAYEVGFSTSGIIGWRNRDDFTVENGTFINIDEFIQIQFPVINIIIHNESEDEHRYNISALWR